MKRVLALATVLVAFAAVACGGDSRESLAREQQSVMKEFADAFDSIKDVESARAAKPKLQSLMTRIKAINERESKLPPMTDAEQKALEEKYSKDMEATMMKMQGAMMRIAFDPAIQAELKDLDFDSINR